MSSGENDIWEGAAALYAAAQAAGKANPAIPWNRLSGKVQAIYTARTQGLPDPVFT